MANNLSSKLCVLFVLFLIVTGCARHGQYRTYTTSPPDFTAPVVETADIEEGFPDMESCVLESRAAERSENDYLLGFAEFDDQGALWNRKQVVSMLKRLEAGVNDHDMLLMVFVHGWQHNASYDDGNVCTFRKLLQTLQKKEDRAQTSRRVVGVYVGWRGRSVLTPGLEYLTFWERKNTAEKIGHGAVTDFLRHVEAWHRERRDLHEHTNDRLVVLGHSFGGAVLYSALSQILIDRFVQFSEDEERKRRMLDGEEIFVHPQSFGDLVVIINPAFEAQAYDTLYQMDRERKYVAQTPVMAILQSEGDWATKVVFPVGRVLSTMFEKHKDAGEKARNRTAIGHYDPFKTHRLDLREEGKAIEGRTVEISGAIRDLLKFEVTGTPEDHIEELVQELSNLEPVDINQLEELVLQDSQFLLDGKETRVSELLDEEKKAILEERAPRLMLVNAWRELDPSSTSCGWSKPVGGMALTHLCTSRAPINTPYLVVEVSSDIISGHNDIDSEEFRAFLAQFIGTFVCDFDSDTDDDGVSSRTRCRVAR